MQVSHQQLSAFRARIRKYHTRHWRNLPWRRTKNPYRILVSEVMLQQTQVARVLIYYPQFLRRFPNFSALAVASVADALRVWQGLGYNRRPLLLQKLARIVIKDHGGKLPAHPAELARLPGIGTATAGAIAAFAFNQPCIFIETNIRRVFLHCFFPRRRAVADSEILPLVARTLDIKNPREWYYALMDYGAALGRGAQINPNLRSRHYTRPTRFAGSNRELRGNIIAFFLAQKYAVAPRVARTLKERLPRVKTTLAALAQEGFLLQRGPSFFIADRRANQRPRRA